MSLMSPLTIDLNKVMSYTRSTSSAIPLILPICDGRLGVEA
jgi:hypothetical protein